MVPSRQTDRGVLKLQGDREADLGSLQPALGPAPRKLRPGVARRRSPAIRLLYAGPALPVNEVTQLAAIQQGDELVYRLFGGVVDVGATLEVLELQEVQCQGEVLVASESWVLHQSLNIEELGQPALASIGRILEVSGSGLCRALWIQVIRYPLLGMPTQEGGRMVVTESQMAASIRDGAVQDELLHLPEQSLAHLGHHFAEGSHRFFYA